jgi:hypothetical protein
MTIRRSLMPKLFHSFRENLVMAFKTACSPLTLEYAIQSKPLMAYSSSVVGNATMCYMVLQGVDTLQIAHCRRLTMR